MYALTDAEREVFRKVVAPRVSDFATSELIVPDGLYAGARCRKDVNPYLFGVMDTWGLPTTEHVMVCGSAQTGKTLLEYACIAWSIVYREYPRMLAMPDEPGIEKMLEQKLDPMFRQTRPVARKLRKIKSRRITFIDEAPLHLAAAASPSQRASLPVGDLFLDEEGLYRIFQGQGAPVAEFIERTRSYGSERKILRVSKPIGDELTSIVADMAMMDEIRDWHVVCPACGVLQVMDEENVIAEHQVKDPSRILRDTLGRYRCPHCKYHWTDYLRDEAVAKGQWIAREAAANPRRFGFHIPAILSSVVSISEIASAKAALDGTDEPEKHQDYANGYWARPYKPIIAASREEDVLSLIDPDLEEGVMPRGYVALTTFVDMQKRGFWFMTCAWTAKLDVAIIDYGTLKDWDAVHKQVFETTYPVESETLGEYEIEPAVIWRSLLDTGGGESENEDISRTEEAYAFIASHGQDILFAAKGGSHKQLNPVIWSNRERMPKSRTAIPGGLRLYLLDTAYFKRWAISRMKKDARQPLRLHKNCGELLARQLTAEEEVLERGKRVWKQRRDDNHLFDCLCGNLALVHDTFSPSLRRLVQGLEEQERQRQEAEALADRAAREGQRKVMEAAQREGAAPLYPGRGSFPRGGGRP